MSKKTRKSASQRSVSQNTTQTVQKLVEQAAQLNDSAMSTATEEDLEKTSTIQAPDSPTVDILKKAVQQAIEVQTLFQEQTKRLQNTQESLAHREKSLTELEGKLSQREAALKASDEEWLKKEQDLEQRLTALQKREDALLTQEESLKERELNAEAGFAKERRESLVTLENEAQVLHDELSTHRRKMTDERAEQLRKQEAQRSEFERNLEIRRTELEQEYHQKFGEMLNEQRKHKKAKDKYEMELELLAEDRDTVQIRISQGIAKKEADYQCEIQRLTKLSARLQSHCDKLQNELAEYQEASRRIGNRSPEQLYLDLEQLQAERDDLNRQLQARPDAGALERLQELTEKQEQWQRAEFSLEQENRALKRQVTQNQIAVADLETLLDQKKTLESNNDLLKAALDELRKEVDERIRRADNKSIFPACTGMDTDERMQETPITDSNSSIKLDEFVADLQQRVAYDSETGKELFYSLRDLRSFVAGLAMSRLHLLQGISGTGKTSLPLAVARALGAGHTLVEVQAGWRDRHDLIGHFNAFERRFYESEFLQALYKAQCPQYQNRLFFIVLDEMNLSHPEQYFADLLSALEQDPEKRSLTLMESAVEPPPQLFSEGRKLTIPSNVWFIGTANHDETTVDFAPKTYDRAHVMELPRHQDHFKIERRSPRQPIVWDNLAQAFQHAWKQYAEAANEAYTFIELHGDLLHERFKLGWGNRLQRQMEHYVPVVIAAGGSLGEATDHLLASKLLRKLKDRYDNRSEDLKTLKGDLETAFARTAFKENFEISQSQSIAILDYELHRLGETP